jgi:shikimate kinase
MTTERNIVLTGPPASGKSSVGRRLARILGRPFVDMDDEISRRLELPITEIFARLGEGAFRHSEASLCRELSARSGLVVAAGGGVLVDPANRATLSSSMLVCLHSPAEELLRRMSGQDGRPLLPGDVTERRLKLTALLEDRGHLYASAELLVDTSGMTPEEVASLVTEALTP